MLVVDKNLKEWHWLTENRKWLIADVVCDTGLYEKISETDPNKSNGRRFYGLDGYWNLVMVLNQRNNALDILRCLDNDSHCSLSELVNPELTDGPIQFSYTRHYTNGDRVKYGNDILVMINGEFVLESKLPLIEVRIPKRGVCYYDE